MSYTIEISLLLADEVTYDLLDIVTNYAIINDCTNIYSDIEYEMNTKTLRQHKIITISFKNDTNSVNFINVIKKQKKIYIESVYNNDTNILIYASKYYLTQRVEKVFSKEFKYQKRTRSYSDTDLLILKTIKPEWYK